MIEVLLSDVNDNAPEFAQELYSVDIPEDSDVGTLITKVHATDKDIGNYIFSSQFINDFHNGQIYQTCLTRKPCE